jgi:hypothetical protein
MVKILKGTVRENSTLFIYNFITPDENLVAGYKTERNDVDEADEILL